MEDYPEKIFFKVASQYVEKYSSLPKNCQTRRLLDVLIENLINRAIKYNYSTDEFDSLLRDALDFVQHMQNVLNPLTSDEPSIIECYKKFLSQHEKRVDPKSWIWKHRDVKLAYRQGENSGHYWPINNDEELAEVCDEYIQRPWMNCELIDKILIDAMIYKEALGFGEDIKPVLLSGDLRDFNSIEHLLKTKRKIFFGNTLEFLRSFLVIALVIFVGLGANQAQGWWAGILASFGMWVLFEINFFIKNIERRAEIKRCANLLTDMQSISSLVGKYPISFFFIREQLIKIADRGAMWKMGIFPILDNAIARSQQAVWD